MQKRYFSKVNNAVTSHYSSAEIHPDFYFQPRKFPEKERYTIVHISNQVQFNGGKGHNELIYVLKVLKERGYDIKLLFIGKDYFDSFSKLRQLASGCGVGDDIIFSGYVEQKQ